MADEPITPARRFAEIDATSLEEMLGACSERCYVPCSDDANFPCHVMFGDCGGSETQYFYRLCCGSHSSGNCYEVALPYKRKRYCGWDENLDCEGEGKWTYYEMQACQ